MKGLLAIAGFAVVGSAHAVQVIDTFPDWLGHTTNGWLKVGQSFEVDPINTTLQNLRFSLAPGNGDVLVQVYKFNASGPTGPALFNRSVTRPAGGGQVFISDVGTVLFPSGTYGFVVDMQGNGAPSVHFNVNQNSYDEGNAFFNDGHAWTSGPNFNLTFRAEFSTLPEPGTVAAVGLGVAGLVARRRRRM